MSCDHHSCGDLAEIFALYLKSLTRVDLALYGCLSLSALGNAVMGELLVARGVGVPVMAVFVPLAWANTAGLAALMVLIWLRARLLKDRIRTGLTNEHEARQMIAFILGAGRAHESSEAGR